MSDIISRLHLMKDFELRKVQKNAADRMRRFDGTIEGKKSEAVLAAMEEEFARRHLPGAVARFKEDFPALFEDSRYLKEERIEKLAAAEFCQRNLSAAAFIAAKDHDGRQALLKSVRHLVGMTNLLQGSFEKPKFLDKISESEITEPFLAALGQLMWAADLPENRVVRFSEAAAPWGLSKWTYATYFLFFSHPSDCMFVKPESMRVALDMSPYPLTYESEVTARLYRGILEFSRWLFGRLEELHPQDMIDVQSFIWYMAPTGKWARD